MARSYAVAPAFAAVLALGAWTGGAGMERIGAAGPGQDVREAAYAHVELPGFVVTLGTAGETVHALAYVDLEVREDAVGHPAGRDRVQEAVLMAAAEALGDSGVADADVASAMVSIADRRLGGSALSSLHVRKITVFTPAR